MKNSAWIGAAGLFSVGNGSLFSSCSGKKERSSFIIPELSEEAIDGKELKAGIIGCGGRGSGAAFNFLSAGKGLTITALADTFEDRINNLADRLKNEKNIDIPLAKRFVGLDAYKKLIDSDVDVVIMATPPAFRPVHFKYATEKGKHSFLEKPVCIDPVGYRNALVTAKQAEVKKLSVLTGIQYRYQHSYIESLRKIKEGWIGEITGGNLYYNQGMLWYRDRNPLWSDGEWMIRDWVNWKWLSGDHIVEQHIHNLDIFCWFTEQKPVSALGFGSRQRRITGDQYDNFSVDFVMENGIHLHSMCRQIDGCANNVSDFIQGTKGSWSSEGKEYVIKDLNQKIIWKYDKEAEQNTYKQTNPYILEHVDWINHIRSGKTINQVPQALISNMAAIMGRESAYSGTLVTWDQMAASPLDYTPQDLSLGKMDMSKFVVPVPGTKR